MKSFDTLFDAKPTMPLPADMQVGGLSLDSRKIKPGDLFLGLQGKQHSGADYLLQAYEAGAVGALLDTPPPAAVHSAALSGVPEHFPVAVVPDLRRRVSAMAARFFNWPASSASIVGVTGTNGKSSICFWSAVIFERLGSVSGICGTLGFGRYNALKTTDLTTPDAIDMQRILACLDNCTHIFIEASSFGLDQGRIEAVPFRYAVFTNLSRDHLDYHQDMAHYWYSKKRLFVYPSLSTWIVNTDDPKGQELCQSDTGVRLIRYGLSTQADIRFADIRPSKEGFSAVLQSANESAALEIPVFGRHNLLNLLAVCALAIAEGHSLEAIARQLPTLPNVPGRMQHIQAESGCTVVVDYAHNPDALELALSALREHGCKRLFCVFGCGGNRDTGKRPVMGEIGSRLADSLWLTNDNPRNEEPMAILRDIQAGCSGTAKIMLMPERTRAIEAALTAAEAGDFVLIAGKGHESHQIVRDQTIPLNDFDIAENWLQQQACS